MDRTTTPASRFCISLKQYALTLHRIIEGLGIYQNLVRLSSSYPSLRFRLSFARTLSPDHRQPRKPILFSIQPSPLLPRISQHVANHFLSHSHSGPPFCTFRAYLYKATLPRICHLDTSPARLEYSAWCSWLYVQIPLNTLISTPS